jgi:hypothetical protein
MLMVAVIGLAVIGAGYALWFQVLTLNATVTTGTLDVQWSDHKADATYSVDVGQTFLAPGDAGFNAVKVASVSCAQQIDPAITGVNNGTGHVLTITDTGLYPYAGCVHHVDIHNDGSVPVHIDTSNFSVQLCTAPDTNCKDINVKVSQPCTIGDDGNTTSPTTHPIAGNDAVWQLHTSGRINCDITIYAEQSALEGTKYSGNVQLIACQWNEDAACAAKTKPFDPLSNP